MQPDLRPQCLREAVRECEARENLSATVAHYAEENVEVAERFLEAAEGAFNLLSEQPELDRRYEDALDADLQQLRVWPIRGFPYLIFYNLRESDLFVVAVIHSSRDLPAFFRKRYCQE